MLVALLSDVHDHTTHLLLALHAAREEGCTHLLFMGDMAGFSTFRTMRDNWEYPMELVFGNNEFEKHAFCRAAEKWSNTRLHGAAADIVLHGRRIFFTHLPWTATRAAESGHYDAVFFGHTHEAEIQQVNETLVVNPGEVYGRQSKPSIGVYDTITNTAKIVCI